MSQNNRAVLCALFGALFCALRNAQEKEKKLETRVAVIGIIVEDENSVNELNVLLHEYGNYVVGRMGVPYRSKGINIISLAVDAPQDVINALSGKIGRISGVSAKTAYSSK